ncbi:hypothetical protein P9209_19005 [Prescottella defluvii]|nr:hypothetical protein P9209_19005 [Prescottella defluvii]
MPRSIHGGIGKFGSGLGARDGHGHRVAGDPAPERRCREQEVLRGGDADLVAGGALDDLRDAGGAEQATEQIPTPAARSSSARRAAPAAWGSGGRGIGRGHPENTTAPAATAAERRTSIRRAGPRSDRRDMWSPP